VRKKFFLLRRTDFCGGFSSLCHHKLEVVTPRSAGDVLNPRMKTMKPLLILGPRILFLNPPNSSEDNKAPEQANLSQRFVVVARDPVCSEEH
jgi:hypothetical protein